MYSNVNYDNWVISFVIPDWDLYNIEHRTKQTIGAKISGINAATNCSINKILKLNIPKANTKILAIGTAAFSFIVLSNITSIN